MIHNPQAYSSWQVGVVIQRKPGVTPWARWSWRATSVLPGAGPADWALLREEGDLAEFHAGTLPVELHGADTEAYVHELCAATPSVYIVMRESEGDAPYDLLLASLSPYEAQDYTDSGEELVEKVPMPPLLMAWVEDFVAEHHEEEVFVKRKRDRKRIDLSEDGIGDPRIGKLSDVYASPARMRRRLQ
ncbi:MAG: DUF3305 domain-containing protein [Silicimonas sp.]|nr:DUF3305 domain-containing protein [Silicimonas sp.]